MIAFRHLIGSLVFAITLQSASAQTCFEIACDQGNDCNTIARQLNAKLPQGLQIKSIGSGIKVSVVGDVDIPNCKAVKHLPNALSLDRGDIYGSIYVSGTMRASGILIYEPNDGGNLAFKPRKEVFVNTGKFFNENFYHIKLDEAKPAVKVQLPKSLEKADCWTAKAQAEVSNFEVVVGATSSAGVYAKTAQITNVSNFSRCKWGEVKNSPVK